MAHHPEGITEIWDIEGIPTESLTFPARNLSDNTQPLVFFLIPGNPGVVQYYEEFMYQLWKECEMGIEVILNLQEQIKHKVDCMDFLLDKYSPLSNFIVAGHSIGAYMALKVLRARPTAPIVKCLNLFPTLHNISKTPKGRQVSILTLPVIRHTAVLLLVMIRVLLIFSPSMFRSIVAAASNQKGRDLAVTCDRLLHPRPMLHATTLGAWEMGEVKELDTDVIAENVSKMIFYYSEIDMWAPRSHFEGMKEKFPNAEVYLCDQNLPHAFVIGYSDVMAAKVAKWIKPLVVL
ncbi:hypothetical protein HDU67_006492 [Dinochytrium kinnereticum]|nr:hypothetical protein HDU67_006492 [Dinochytrium kinnereticum]